MGKQQVWFLTTCVFLFLSLASQINSTSRKHLQETSSANPQKLKENDLIKTLPGQPSDVSFKQYGGYVAVDESVGRYLYYYFVEAINANASTPLILWLNGGPGCSSLQGAFVEHGPFRVHSDGKTLYRNPYAWNNVANVLYLESPALVGFSYTNAPTDQYREKLLAHGDKLTKEDNYAFLVKWLERFPEYKGREFYITGQSYAGHYAPQLAELIIQRKNQTFIDLRGVMMGNPGLDRTEEEKGEDEFLIGHGIKTQELINRFSPGQPYHGFAEQFAYNSLKDTIPDFHNIYAPPCLNSTLTSKPKEHASVLNYEPCGVDYMTAYLNNATVQEAMHANTTKKIPYPWRKCADMTGDWNRPEYYASMLPILRNLMGAGVRLFVYSGDVDLAVPFTGTRRVLKKFNQEVVKMLRPWNCEGDIGGYVEEYKNNFTYATVRGGGHSVPTDQPIRALTLFTSFLRNTELPKLPEY